MGYLFLKKINITFAIPVQMTRNCQYDSRKQTNQ